MSNLKFKKIGKFCDRTAYDLYLGGEIRGKILYFTAKELALDGADVREAHWALLHKKGHIDRFETLREAKDEALKTYSAITKPSDE